MWRSRKHYKTSALDNPPPSWGGVKSNLRGYELSVFTDSMHRASQIADHRPKRGGSQDISAERLHQQVLNPTPLNPTPATCHKRKRKLRCNFRNAALQKLHCNIGLRFSAVRMSFWPKAALQQAKKLQCNTEKLHCRKVLSCRFQAPTFRRPRLVGLLS